MENEKKYVSYVHPDVLFRKCHVQALQYKREIERKVIITFIARFTQKSCMTLDAADYDHNLSSIAFARKTEEIAVKSSTTLNCSFMYTQMLKEILLTLDFNEEHFKEFPAFCRKSLTGNSRELQKVDKIEKEYSSQSNSVVGI